MRSISTLHAAIATVLFAGTLGVLIAVTVFGIARVGDQMLEAVNLIPLHWGESHNGTLLDIALTASLPVVVWFSWWFFRERRAAEAKLAGYTYTPPEI